MNNAPDVPHWIAAFGVVAHAAMFFILGRYYERNKSK